MSISVLQQATLPCYLSRIFGGSAHRPFLRGCGSFFPILSSALLQRRKKKKNSLEVSGRITFGSLFVNSQGPTEEMANGKSETRRDAETPRLASKNPNPRRKGVVTSEKGIYVTNRHKI